MDKENYSENDIKLMLYKAFDMACYMFRYGGNKCANCPYHQFYDDKGGCANKIMDEIKGVTKIF